jgi:hypothetical protein
MMDMNIDIIEDDDDDLPNKKRKKRPEFLWGDSF